MLLHIIGSSAPQTQPGRFEPAQQARGAADGGADAGELVYKYLIY